MDIVLLEDVKTLGAEGIVIKVKPGYARNYLFPRGLAALATEAQRKSVKERGLQRARKQERLKAQMEALKKKVEGQSLTLKLSLGEKDKTFGAVTSNDILEALKQEEISIDKHAVQLEEPIRSLGVYEVPIRLHPEVTATLKLWVVKA